VLRSVDPPLSALTGRTVTSIERLGKRIVLGFGDDLYAVIHLMIAGRLRWEKRGAKPPGKIGLAAFDFPTGTLLLTEASPKKRAALYVVRGAAALAAHNPGGLEVMTAGFSTRSAPPCGARTTRSNAPSPIHIFSAASATRT
jgi:formamidopyrimidine-DNA glycosylase